MSERLTNGPFTLPIKLVLLVQPLDICTMPISISVENNYATQGCVVIMTKTLNVK